jgi:hypothetical protein
MQQVKVELFLLLTKNYDMNAYGGMDVETPVFSTSALDEDEGAASRSSRFTLENMPPVHTGSETGWSLEVVWAIWKSKKALP